jgi:broad specificity phosphatase PhoE
MSQFYLVRHAVNDFVGKAIAGWLPNVHLNQEGVQQAEAVAERLSRESIQRIYCSPLERTRQTAAPLAKRLGLEVQVTEELGEVRFGEWTNKTLKELSTSPHWNRYNSFRSGTRAPNGEHMLEIQLRVTSHIDKLRSQFPNDSIALFSHGDVIRAALLYYLGMPLDFYHRLEISPASFSIVELYEDGVRVLGMNCQ